MVKSMNRQIPSGLCLRFAVRKRLSRELTGGFAAADAHVQSGHDNDQHDKDDVGQQEFTPS